MKPIRSTRRGVVTQDRFNEQTAKVLSNISFGSTTSNGDPDQNMAIWKATGVSPNVAGTEFAITHGLGRIPIGYNVVSADKAGHIYRSTTAWTATTAYFKADVASINYVIFIL